MNKHQKPVLTGQRFKTRKRGKVVLCVCMCLGVWRVGKVLTKLDCRRIRVILVSTAPPSFDSFELWMQNLKFCIQAFEQQVIYVFDFEQVI